jgi:hypothetical protein
MAGLGIGDQMNIRRSRMGALRTMAAILFLAACHIARCGNGTHDCPDSAFLRGLLLHDLTAEAATQSFYVGPLRDGRTLRIDSYYVDLHGAGIASIGPISGNRYKLSVDRMSIIKSILVFDAWYLCQHNNRSVCQRFFQYTEEISGASRVERLSLVDQLFKLNPAEICRDRSGSPYPLSLLSSIQTLLRQAMLHELGHVVLQSTTSSYSRSWEYLRAMESEADGFAVMTVRIAQLAPAVPANLLLEIMSPLPTQNSIHPPAWCRLNSSIAEVTRWKQDHPSEARTDYPRYRLSELERDYGASYPQVRGIYGGRAVNCSSYDRDYSRGIARTPTFIDKNTRIETTPPP